MPLITLYTPDIAASLAAERWWELPSLRRLLHGQTATILGHDAGPDLANPGYAFLAADVSPTYSPALKTVRRFFVQLGRKALLTLDVAIGPGPVSWKLEGEPNPNLRHRPLLPKAGQTDREDRIFLNVWSSPTATVETLTSLDLAGARLDQAVVIFHTEMGMARSGVFFDVRTKGTLQFLLAGLSPGLWEIWRDGFLEGNARTVLPQHGTLYFENEGGDYFLRQP